MAASRVAAAAKTTQLLRYANMVRRHLLPPDPPILDYTRAHADDVFHDMWTSNSISGEQDYKNRVFREWSLVERAKEEMQLTAREISGVLSWTKRSTAKQRVDMDRERLLFMKAYRASLFIIALQRQQVWEEVLLPLMEHVEDWTLNEGPMAVDERHEAWI